VPKRFGQDSNQLLRESSVLKLGAPFKRFFHLWWDISPNQDAFSLHDLPFLSLVIVG
jgi:hypothetical protein